MSEAAKHTPGPWKVCEYLRGGGVVRHIVQVATGKGIAEVAAHAKKPISEANARLIAAAPDLLAALEAAASSAGFQYMLSETRDQIDTALAQARKG